MTNEEYNRLAYELQRRGYRKYPSPRFRKIERLAESFFMWIEKEVKV